MKTVARVNMMGLGCGDGPTAGTPGNPATLTMPLLPTLSQSPGSNPSTNNDTGNLCGLVDWVAQNQLSTLVVVAVAAWAFASATKGGR